jgi:hypothetical protein
MSTCNGPEAAQAIGYGGPNQKSLIFREWTQAHPEAAMG